MSASSPEDQNTKSASGSSTTQASIAPPIPQHGSEAEFEPTKSSRDRSMDVNCSLEAAQRGLWHRSMNIHGIYRPRGIVRVLDNGKMQWREHEKTPWCKFSFDWTCKESRKSKKLNLFFRQRGQVRGYQRTTAGGVCRAGTIQ